MVGWWPVVKRGEMVGLERVGGGGWRVNWVFMGRLVGWYMSGIVGGSGDVMLGGYLGAGLGVLAPRARHSGLEPESIVM